MEEWLFISLAALVASTVAAIAGTGGGIILLPVLIEAVGVREAVPMYAVVQPIGNMSRVVFNRQLIQLPVVFWFCIGAIPFSILGAWLFTKIPDSKLLNIIGTFLIFTVIWRHWQRHTIASFNPKYFALHRSNFFSYFGNRWQCRPISCAILSFLRTCQRCVYRN